MSSGRIADPSLIAVASRIGAFHPPDPGSDALAELRILVDRLRLQEVKDELSELFESGVESPDADARGSSLLRTQSEIKARLAKVRHAD